MGFIRGFPRGSVVENSPAMQEMQETEVQSLGGEDPLKKGMTTHSSVLAWRIPWTEEPGGLQSLGSQRIRHEWRDWACTSFIYIWKLSLRGLDFCQGKVNWYTVSLWTQEEEASCGYDGDSGGSLCYVLGAFPHCSHDDRIQWVTVFLIWWKFWFISC